MTAAFDFDRLLADVIDASGPHELPAGFVDEALDLASHVPQRRPRLRVLDERGWPSGRISAADPATRRFVLISLAALLAIALIGAALTIGRSFLAPSYRNIFVRTGPIPGQLRSVWPVTMGDGRVLVIGGWPGATDNNATNAASILDPATGVFTRTGDMLTEHDNGVPVALADGRILVVAGMRNAEDPASGLTPPMSAVELYDPAIGTFRLTDPLSSPRYAMSVIRLRDGRVLVAGGAECLGVPEDCPDSVAKADLYDPATDQFSPTGSLVHPLAAGAPALLPDGRVLIVGYGTAGADGVNGPAISQRYDPDTGRFEQTASTTEPCSQIRVVERHAESPLVVCSDRVRRTVVDAQGHPVLHRGEIQEEEVSAPSTVERYDPDLDRFTLVGTLPYPADGALERLDGRIVVYGTTTGSGRVGDQSVWAGLFDPVTGTTELIQAPSRMLPLATTLPDGRVVLVGGDDPLVGEPMYDAEILE